MKPKSLAVAMALAGLTVAGSISPALADSSKEQSRSAATGLVIGAVAGGPIGAFTGAVLGGEIFGRLFEHRRVNNELTVHVADLTGKLNASQTSHTRKDQVITALNQDLDKVLSIQSSAAKSQQLPVQFRTSSDVLEPQYEAELKQIANVLRRNQDATVTLSGFADRRGDDQFNQALSEKRVRRVFNAETVPGQQWREFIPGHWHSFWRNQAADTHDQARPRRRCRFGRVAREQLLRQTRGR